MKLLNISNHPSSGWSEAQKRGWEIIDVPFPAINPTASEKEVFSLAISFAEQVKEIYENNSFDAIMLMGEFSFCYILLFHLLEWMLENGISVAIPTTERKVVEQNGKKVSEFDFVRWRAITPAEIKFLFNKNKEAKK